METKTIDNLLNELNEVQLKKESLSSIMGGIVQCGYVVESVGTHTGTVTTFYCPATECYTMYWNGGQIFPHELSERDRS